MTSDQDAIRIVMLVTLSLSVSGCLFICFVYLYFQDIRSFAFKLIFYMSLMDIGHAIGFFLPMNPDSMCIIQALITSYFSLSSVLWTAAIAYSLHAAVVKRTEGIEKLEFKFLIFANGLPALAVIPPIANGLYGEAQGWCWIQASGATYTSGTCWRMATFYVPLWMVITFNLFVYLKVIRYLKKETKFVKFEDETAKRVIRRLILYPLVLVVCYTLPTANRIYDLANPDETYFPLSVAAGGLMCLCGLCNAVVYGFTDTVRMRLREWVSPVSKLTESFSTED